MANGIVIPITGSGAEFEAALKRIEQAMEEAAERSRRMNGELEESGRRVGEAFERSVPRVAAASGAIREFEGALPIRAVERFLTDVLGMGPLLQAAFPLIGAVAFGEMLVRIGKEIFTTEEAAAHAAETIKGNWISVNQELTASADALDTQVDRLIEETDKLLGHPGSNRLAVMFDESREAADKLGKSIEEDIKKADELEKKKDNHIGFFGGLLGAGAPTGGTEKLLAAANKQILDAKREYDGVLSRAGASGDQSNIDQAQTARLVALQNVYGRVTVALQKDLSDFQKIQDGYEASGHAMGRDVSANINLLVGALENLDAQQRKIGASYAEEMAARQRTDAGDGGKKAAELANTLARIDEEDARQQQSKAQEEMRKLEELSEGRLRIAAALASRESAISRQESQARIADLEAEHNAGVISQTSYYQKRLQVVLGAIAQERAALETERSAIDRALRAAGDEETPETNKLNLQLVDIDTKLKELAGQRAIEEAKTSAEIALQVRLQERQKQEGMEFLAKDAARQQASDARPETKLNQEGAKAATQAAGSFFEQLSSGAIRGKLSMKSLVDSAISDLDRFAMKLLEERALLPLMNQLFGVNVGGPAGNGWSSPAEVSALENSAAFQQFAGGGEIPDGGMAIVGDGGDGSGSELFAPKGPGTVLPHEIVEGIAKGGAGGGNAAPSVVVNNINNSSSNVAMRSSGVSWDAGAKQFVINTLLEDMQMGGSTAQAMRGLSASGG